MASHASWRPSSPRYVTLSRLSCLQATGRARARSSGSRETTRTTRRTAAAASAPRRSSRTGSSTGGSRGRAAGGVPRVPELRRSVRGRRPAGCATSRFRAVVRTHLAAAGGPFDSEGPAARQAGYHRDRLHRLSGVRVAKPGRGSLLCRMRRAARAPRCPRCGADDRPAQKFCNACGQTPRRCPPVAREPRAYTPKHLAEKILTSRAALEGERKQVTVLFADVKGSMELAEQLDPEEWHAHPRALLPASSPTACTASRARSTSTPATASWRSSARRSRTRTTRSARATRRSTCATRCARYARRAAASTHGLNFSRAHGPQLGRGRGRQDRRRPAHGLHGAGAHGRARAAHGAARRAGTASTSREHTAPARRGLLRARAISARSRVKGVERAGARLRARGRRARCARASTRRGRAGLSRFVGRADEMARARGGARAARSPGTGRWSASSREAGTGKSRLCCEFVERCRARGITRARGARRRARARRSRSCPSSSCSAAIFGIGERDAAQAAREKIAGALAAARSPTLERRAARCSSTSSACPTPSAAGRRSWRPRRASARLFAVVRRVDRGAQRARARRAADRGPALDRRRHARPSSRALVEAVGAARGRSSS